MITLRPLKEIMKQRNISEQELAEMIGVTMTTMEKIMRADGRISVKHYEKICQVLELRGLEEVIAYEDSDTVKN